jgi:hypothetical protein
MEMSTMELHWVRYADVAKVINGSLEKAFHHTNNGCMMLKYAEKKMYCLYMLEMTQKILILLKFPK